MKVGHQQIIHINAGTTLRVRRPASDTYHVLIYADSIEKVLEGQHGLPVSQIHLQAHTARALREALGGRS